MLNTKTPMTVDQAADELGLSPPTPRGWVAQRRIGRPPPGGALRIPVAEVARLLDEGAVPARRAGR